MIGRHQLGGRVAAQCREKRPGVRCDLNLALEIMMTEDLSSSRPSCRWYGVDLYTKGIAIGDIVPFEPVGELAKAESTMLCRSASEYWIFSLRRRRDIADFPCQRRCNRYRPFRLGGVKRPNQPASYYWPCPKGAVTARPAQKPLPIHRNKSIGTE